jgi:hypothetical protein
VLSISHFDVLAVIHRPSSRYGDNNSADGRLPASSQKALSGGWQMTAAAFESLVILRQREAALRVLYAVKATWRAIADDPELHLVTPRSSKRLE